MAEPFTREYIREWIKRKLGSPLIEVELDEDQIEDCIDDALDEVAPWVVQRQYITLPASQCIDLSEYKIAYVINVHKADGSDGTSNTSQLDVFNPYSYLVVTSRQGMVYSQLENILYNKQMGDLKDNISFKFISNKLYLDIGYPTATKVTIEYSPQITDVGILDKDDEDSRLYRKFVKRFALAYARATLANIRGKFTISGSPAELDADRQDSKSDSEIESLREELRDTVSTHFAID